MGSWRVHYFLMHDCFLYAQTELREPFWLQIRSHSPIINTGAISGSFDPNGAIQLPETAPFDNCTNIYLVLHCNSSPVELYTAAPDWSHYYTFMFVIIALLVGKGAKCTNDSLGSLKSSFIFLCVFVHLVRELFVSIYHINYEIKYPWFHRNMILLFGKLPQPSNCKET